MLLDILKQINWVDIFVLILIVRVCFIAAKGGLPIELFKFLGTAAAIFFACHYFTVLSDYISNWLALGERLPLEFLQFIVFVFLAIGGYAASILLRSIFYRFLKMEAVSGLNKWGSLILGIARGALLASLIIFAMFISSITYFKSSAQASYSGKHLFAVAPNIYSWLWGSVVSKFALKEKFNDKINSINEEFSRK